MKISAVKAIEQYIASWNEKTEKEIRAAFSKCWAGDATYTDPKFDLIKGVEGITQLAVSSHQIAPGRVFGIKVQPDSHHNVTLYTWGVHIPGKGNGEGRDYIEFNEEGKIARLVSFYKRLL